jgi:hypothetical protein
MGRKSLVFFAVTGYSFTVIIKTSWMMSGVTTPNLVDQSVWRALTVSSGVEVPHCYYTLKSYWQCDCCPLVYDSGLRKNLGSPGALWTHQSSVIQLKVGAISSPNQSKNNFELDGLKIF